MVTRVMKEIVLLYGLFPQLPMTVTGIVAIRLPEYGRSLWRQGRPDMLQGFFLCGKDPPMRQADDAFLFLFEPDRYEP